ncbi:MAG: lipoyl domain-containing protein [Kordiimonadaceae bacterium]|nr:lipoyl domain-containing protein [Kordiimonadaceae bacterium]MBO6567717.1 lipoyl domain-containing protein [Kordiimonadaceae bacterium]MBO6963068.1 lipoyl domain-containing protein [Kordiimonadaceae bacterium]
MALVEVHMPSLGEQTKEVVFLSWMKKIGEQVQIDEPVFKVEMATGKTILNQPMGVEVEILSQDDGVLVETHFKKKQRISVGDTAGILDTEAAPTVKQKKSWFAKMFGLDG